MRLEKLKDGELISQFNSTGKEKFFGELMSRYNDKLFNYIIRKVGNMENAKDIYQNTWLKIANSLPKYQDEGKFSNYLFFVATNASYDHFRKIRKDNENLYFKPASFDEDGKNDQIESLKSEDLNPEEENIEIESKEFANDAINELPENQREVILLRSEGFSFKEIAEMTNVSINSLLSRYRYGIDKIKKMMKV